MIYFDNAATTRICPKALDAFVSSSQEDFANPNSTHAFGVRSNRIVEESRAKILAMLKSEKTHDLLFTSGATEANNIAIKGFAAKYHNRGNKILVSAYEHPSVTNAFKELKEKHGFDVVTIPVDNQGKLDYDFLESNMDSSVILVSVMGVNNETGSVNDLRRVAFIVHKYPKAIFHSDLTQAIGKIDFPFQDIDAFSFSAHKFEGPKGVGCLVYRKKLSPERIIQGGEQEHGLRPGTIDLPSIVSMKVALEESYKRKSLDYPRIASLHDELLGYVDNNPELTLNSPRDGTSFLVNFSFKRKKASVVTEALSREGIYVSSVSACSSKGEPISEVLLSMGKDEGSAANSMRVSFSYDSTMEEVKTFEKTLDRILMEVHDR